MRIAAINTSNKTLLPESLAALALRKAWRYTVKTKKYQLGFSGLSGSIS
jgi:hypothetical protein